MITKMKTVKLNSPCDMPVFYQLVRIEQQLCSIAQFGGTKIPHEFKKRRCYDDAQTFFGKDATKLNIKRNKRSVSRLIK